MTDNYMTIGDQILPLNPITDLEVTYPEYATPEGMVKLEMCLTTINGKVIVEPVYMYKEQFDKLSVACKQMEKLQRD